MTEEVIFSRVPLTPFSHVSVIRAVDFGCFTLCRSAAVLGINNGRALCTAEVDGNSASCCVCVVCFMGVGGRDVGHSPELGRRLSPVSFLAKMRERGKDRERRPGEMQRID